MEPVKKYEGEFELSGGVVHPWHLDQFGHMNVRWYAHAFDDASFLFWNRCGLDLSKSAERHGVHSVTAQATTEFKAALVTGDCFRVLGGVTRIGTKSVSLRFRLVDAATLAVRAVYATVEVFVDAGSHASVEIPTAVRGALERHHAPEGSP